MIYNVTITNFFLFWEGLVDPSKHDQIVLDGPLTRALYKNEENPPDRVSRKDLPKIWADRMGAAFALVEMPGSKIFGLRKGLPPKVEIEVSMRQSKKFVTRVRGFRRRPRRRLVDLLHRLPDWIFW